jgi:hypothetical protein
MNAKHTVSAIWRFILIVSLVLLYALLLAGFFGAISARAVSGGTLLDGLIACIAMIAYLITAQRELKRIWG